jgi:Fe-S cluster biogenesis protein NfuA
MSAGPTVSGASAGDTGASAPNVATLEGVVQAHIRPLLRIHGGDIDVRSVSERGEVELEFQGACRACALKSITYAIGVRERLRHVPGVTDVRIRGVNLSDAALERVAAAYSTHPLFPVTPTRAGGRA